MPAKLKTFFPLPGTFQDTPISLVGSLVDGVAYLFDADAEEITSTDVYWGGEHADENSTEVFTVRGEIVGSTDAISADDWRALLANRNNVCRASTARLPKIA